MIDQTPGDGGGEHRLAGDDEADGAKDLRRWSVLEQEAARARPQRPQDVVGGTASLALTENGAALPAGLALIAAAMVLTWLTSRDLDTESS